MRGLRAAVANSEWVLAFHKARQHNLNVGGPILTAFTACNGWRQKGLNTLMLLLWRSCHKRVGCSAAKALALHWH